MLKTIFDLFNKTRLYEYFKRFNISKKANEQVIIILSPHRQGRIQYLVQGGEGFTFFWQSSVLAFRSLSTETSQKIIVFRAGLSPKISTSPSFYTSAHQYNLLCSTNKNFTINTKVVFAFLSLKDFLKSRGKNVLFLGLCFAGLCCTMRTRKKTLKQ